MPTRKKAATTSAADRSIVITRLLDAPRDLVFRAFTDPMHVDRWWGPTGFRNTTTSIDVRPGGVWSFMMHGPDGTDYPNVIAFKDVVPPERLTFSHGSGDDATFTPFDVTVTFARDGAKTRLTMTSVFATAEERKRQQHEVHAEEGGNQTLDRLEQHLAARHSWAGGDLVVARILNAPRALVWHAWTDPEHMKRWYGPEVFKAPTIKIDLRVGGKHLYGMRGPDGSQYWSTGVYREVVPLVRLAYTDSISDERGNVVPAAARGLPSDWPDETLVTVTFEDHPGSMTKLTVRQSGIPQGMMGDHALAGWDGSLDKLAASLR